MGIKKQIDENFKVFAKQEGQQFSLRFVFWSWMDDLIAKGDRGDQDARSTVFSVGHWFEMVRKGQDENIRPSCLRCRDEITPKNLSGWAIAVPANGSMGLMIPFCHYCAEKGAEVLTQEFFDQAKLEGIIMAAVH
jgi:hypothetical protein